MPRASCEALLSLTVMALPGTLPDLPADPVAALVSVLIARGALSPPALERARRAAEVEGLRLDRALNQLGLVADEALAAGWSEATGLAIATAPEYPEQPPLADTLSPAFLQNARCFPLKVADGHVTIALEDPLDSFTPAAVAAKAGLAVSVAIAIRGDLDRALQRLSATPADIGADILPRDGIVGISDDVERLRELASDAPVIRFVNRIVERAVELKASDIHFTASINGSRLRYRVDGVLREVDAPPAELHNAILSRIKIMAGLDIAERRLPQDGRVRAAFRGREIDFRIATMPHAHGEGVVLRLLDKAAVALNLETLGLSPHSIAGLRKALHAPHGMVLVTGPTGSGKTTTLYAALGEVRGAERNIVTIEDPVEYGLDGINQIQIAPRIGLDFAQALRAVLRQDPDVIMVGEIRDGETATVATRAALTGHLVLATIHTNTAAGALPRLIDMGVEPFLLASTVRGVLAQRLVRRVCPLCSGSAGTLACPSCGTTGYVGRTAVSEFIVLDDELRQAVGARADEATVAAIARRKGNRDMAADGKAKVAARVTTAEEVLRAMGDI